jgi:succinate dehydrogenase assembly factor 1
MSASSGGYLSFYFLLAFGCVARLEGFVWLCAGCCGFVGELLWHSGGLIIVGLQFHVSNSAKKKKDMVRFSPIQKEASFHSSNQPAQVIGLYRNCLRAVKNKDPPTHTEFKQFIRAEFSEGLLLKKNDFEAIEFMLRKGTRKLEMLQAPHLKSIAM